MDAVTIGPLSFSTGVLATLAAVLASSSVGNWLARRRKLDIELQLWLVILAALVAARLAYVLRFGRLYTAAPWSILDVRDGGFNLAVGLSTGLLLAAMLAWRNRPARLPVLAAAASGAAVFALLAALQWMFPQPPVRLPQVALLRIEGGVLQLVETAGKPVVLNLWASWCGPCRREMPVMRQAQLDHPDVVFVFANQGESAAEIRNYLDQHKLMLANVVLDERNSIGAALKSKVLPTTFFFDRSGKLVGRRTGELSAATLSEQLDALR